MAPDQRTDFESTLTDTFNAHVLDSVYMLKSDQILLTEDMYFRQIAETQMGVKAVFLQSVLSFARNTGIITDERYADCISDLSARKHSYISVDAITLINLVENDATGELVKFSSVIEYIGTQNADMRSHISVTLAFLSSIWRNDGAAHRLRFRKLPVYYSIG